MIWTRRSKENAIEKCGCPSMASNSNSQVFCWKEVKVSKQENVNKIESLFEILSGIECHWIGSQSEVMNHVMSSHTYETQEKSGPFPVQLQNISKYKNFHKALHILDTFFYMHWVIKEGIVHFLVFVIPKQTSEEYAYDFRFQKYQEQIAITGGVCSSFSHHENKLLETGDIVRLHRGTVQNFVGENGELLCVIEIRRKQANSSSSEVSDKSDMEEELCHTDEVQGLSSKFGKRKPKPIRV